MTRKTFHLLGLLIFLIVSGCTTAPYQIPSPYPTRPAPQPEVKRPAPGPESTTSPSQPSPGLPANPIVADISQQADRLVQSGQLDPAAQTLERGLRIAPKDASLWSQLAAVRLRQKRYGQARSLAAKSNSLAGGNMAIIQNNQRILDEAQRKGQ